MKSVIDTFVTAMRRWAGVRRAPAALAAIVVAFAAAGPAAARPKSALTLVPMESPADFAAQRGGGGISLSQATAIATSRFEGRVVRAETVNRGDRVVHEVRILGDDGRVRTVRIDAQTGSFL